jgi:hypothetical protein
MFLVRWKGTNETSWVKRQDLSSDHNQVCFEVPCNVTQRNYSYLTRNFIYADWSGINALLSSTDWFELFHSNFETHLVSNENIGAFFVTPIRSSAVNLPLVLFKTRMVHC